MSFRDEQTDGEHTVRSTKGAHREMFKYYESTEGQVICGSRKVGLARNSTKSKSAGQCGGTASSTII